MSHSTATPLVCAATTGRQHQIQRPSLHLSVLCVSENSAELTPYRPVGLTVATGHSKLRKKLGGGGIGSRLQINIFLKGIPTTASMEPVWEEHPTMRNAHKRPSDCTNMAAVPYFSFLHPTEVCKTEKDLPVRIMNAATYKMAPSITMSHRNREPDTPTKTHLIFSLLQIAKAPSLQLTCLSVTAEL